MFATASFAATDPDEFVEMIRGSRVEVVSTEAGPFRASITRVDLNALWMQQCRETVGRTFRTVIPADRVVVGFLSAAQAPVHMLTAAVADGELLVMSPGEAACSRTSGTSAWGCVSLPTELFHRHGVNLCGRDVLPAEVQQALRPSAADFAHLRRLHAAICAIAKTDAGAAGDPGATRGLEQHLIAAVFAAISGAEELGSLQRYHRQRVMARFEDLIEANPDRPIYLPEVCEAVGVTPRTLNNYCLEHLGMCPSDYLRLRRMHQVHRRLRQSDPAFTSVTAVATRHGFWELGRFSVAYRRLFGESPSVTLHRAPHRPEAASTMRIFSESA